MFLNVRQTATRENVNRNIDKAKHYVESNVDEYNKRLLNAKIQLHKALEAANKAAEYQSDIEYYQLFKLEKEIDDNM